MKLLVMQFPQISRHIIPLWSKHSPQHPVLKHPQSMFSPCPRLLVNFRNETKSDQFPETRNKVKLSLCLIN
jgi:hypothetical protein